MKTDQTPHFRTRVAERLAHLGLSARVASMRAGLNPDTLGKFLAGKTKSIKASNLNSLARVLDVSESWLIGSASDPSATPDLPFGVKFGGTVEAGTFRLNDGLDQDGELKRVPMPYDSRFPPEAQFAFKVAGDSMTEARIFDGMHVLALDVHAWERVNGEPADGALVVVARTRAGAPERELTIKRLRVKRDRIVLEPCSKNPAHQPITFPRSTAADSHDASESAEILAICLQAVWILA